MEAAGSGWLLLLVIAVLLTMGITAVVKLRRQEGRRKTAWGVVLALVVLAAVGLSVLQYRGQKEQVRMEEEMAMVGRWVSDDADYDRPDEMILYADGTCDVLGRNDEDRYAADGMRWEITEAKSTSGDYYLALLNDKNSHEDLVYLYSRKENELIFYFDTYRREPLPEPSETDPWDGEDWEPEAPAETPEPPAEDPAEPPSFLGQETMEVTAPYQALALEYDGHLYYLDKMSNLCRTNLNMEEYEIFCPQPFGERNRDTYLYGVTNAGRLYIGVEDGPSCYVALTSGAGLPERSVQPLTTTTFAGNENQVELWGISNSWMYYTKDQDADDYLYRCGLGGDFETEEIVLDQKFNQLAITENEIIYTTREREEDKRNMFFLPLDGTGEARVYTECMPMIIGDVSNGFLLYSVEDYYSGVGLYNLADGSVVKSFQSRDDFVKSDWATYYLTYVPSDDGGRLFRYVDGQLTFLPVSELETLIQEGRYYTFTNGKQFDDDVSAQDMTLAGDYFFFRSVDMFDTGGVGYCVERHAQDLILLS